MPATPCPTPATASLGGQLPSANNHRVGRGLKVPSPAKALWWLALAVVLAGCQTGRSGTPTDLYLLGPTPAAPQTAEAPTPTALTGHLYLEEVSLPAYLRRTEIARRTSADTLTYRSNQRWAEPLEDSLARRFATALRLAAPQATVTNTPPSDLQTAIRIRLRFDQFEATHPDQVVLSGQAMILRRGSQDFLPIFESATLRGSSVSLEVEALGKLVDQAARNLAQHLVLNPHPAP